MADFLVANLLISAFLSSTTARLCCFVNHSTLHPQLSLYLSFTALGTVDKGK